ncbi:alpha/beta hydrolase-fold protein [Ruminococcus sp.]|uniref:alpha/beta hydrolase-fold protein n=1 Tax=Ruminococcus sp. TaxID=41978 RepID=UPI0025F474C6|nr:alpha/beta hydrolase-fold protein [Ruminococcus sp.]
MILWDRCVIISKKAAVRGDINSDGRVDAFDLILCRKGVVNMFSGGQVDPSTDIDGDGKTQVNDLVLLSQYILGERKDLPPAAVTTTETTTSEPPVTTSTTQNGDSYMQKMAADIHMHEEPSVLETRGGVDYGTIEKKPYFSKDAQREKNLNILLPPGYDSSQKYPVIYVFHGIFGSEDSMLDESMKIQTMLGNLVASGEAEKMIIVFPQMFTTKENIFPAFTNESSRAYDAIREDLENSIMPFMKENYPIKEGRENTAVTGFSMGGREALYVGVTRPDLYGYVGGVCPAPGIFPTVDGNMTHEGCISPSEFCFGSAPSPYVLMITCTRFDGTVGDAPDSYHDTLTQNGVEHIWHQLTDGDHGSISVRAHMYNFLRYVFKAK